MISENIKELINITESFIQYADPELEFSRNMENLTGMLKGSCVKELQMNLKADLANNGAGIASEVANKFLYTTKDDK